MTGAGKASIILYGTIALKCLLSVSQPADASLQLENSNLTDTALQNILYVLHLGLSITESNSR